MHGTGVNQVATDMLCPYQGMPAFQKTSALNMVLKQRVGQFPILSSMTLSKIAVGNYDIPIP